MSIKEVNIREVPYEELDKLFFHHGDKKYHTEVEKNGIPSLIGNNSKYIDSKKSIFFSIGVENTLKLIDVWIKWRLDRLNNPFFNAMNNRRIINSPEEKEEYNRKWQEWYNLFVTGKYKNVPGLLEKLYEFELTEGLASCYYYILDLKENEEYVLDQIDDKKKRTTDLAKLKAFYGSYSDFTTPVADKWNMQTIPGKDITVEPERIRILSVDGKKDVISIVKYLYELYLEHTKEKANFMILDDFIEYTKTKERTR